MATPRKLIGSGQNISLINISYLTEVVVSNELFERDIYLTG